MPQVVRGSRAGLEGENGAYATPPTSPSVEPQSRPSFALNTTSQESANADSHRLAAIQSWRSHQSTNTNAHEHDHDQEQAVAPQSPPLRHVAFRADSNEPTTSPHPIDGERRRSSFFLRRPSEDRPEADAYYDSRAGTRREWRRRATTLQDYYHENPDLLPQLPFTWHRGKKRWRLIFLIFLMWVDACAVPIALYYGLTYGGDVEGWITFAVVTTIWGGPTYLEFGVRTFKLMKKERFYRPLGTNSRWCFDYLNWTSTITIAVVTALFIIGSAPHIVWLRVLCMPMPALLYCLGFLTGFPTLYYHKGWKAPFRLSSTAKGDPVKPAIYYFMEDTVAVNANAGRPYREALAARWEASPRFRRMIFIQSVFWSIPAIIIAVPLTIIAVIHPVPATVAYAFCWAIPFIWATIWGLISLWWCKRDMVRERLEWESRPPLAQKIKDESRGLDTETSSSAPITSEDDRVGRPENRVTPSQEEDKTAAEQAV